MQFTLDELGGGFRYGEGAQIDAPNPDEYILPAFEYRVYARRPDDGGDWRNAATRDTLVHHGSVVSARSNGTATDGRPIFSVQFRVPRESIESDLNWLVISPRIESYAHQQEPIQSALDPVEPHADHVPSTR